MTELLAQLPTSEEKANWLYIRAVDQEALKKIERTFEECGLMWARLHIAAWFEAEKAEVKKQKSKE